MENLGLLLDDNLILTTHDVLPERDSGAGGEVLLSVTEFDFEGQRPGDKRPSPDAVGRLQLIKKLQPWRCLSSALHCSNHTPFFGRALLLYVMLAVPNTNESRIHILPAATFIVLLIHELLCVPCARFFATDPVLNLSAVAIEESETGTMTKAGLKPVDMTGPCPGEGEELYVVTQRGGPSPGSSLHCCAATCTTTATARTGPAPVRWRFGASALPAYDDLTILGLLTSNQACSPGAAAYNQQGNFCLLILASKKVQGRKGLARGLVYEHTAIPVDSILSWLEQHRVTERSTTNAAALADPVLLPSPIVRQYMASTIGCLWQASEANTDASPSSDVVQESSPPTRSFPASPPGTEASSKDSSQQTQHARYQQGLARVLDISNEEVSPLDLTITNSASSEGAEAAADADTLMPVSLHEAAPWAFGNSGDSISVNDSDQVDDVLSAPCLKKLNEPDLVRGLLVRDTAARSCESRTPTSSSEKRAAYVPSGMKEDEGSFQEVGRIEHQAEAPKHSPAQFTCSMQNSDSYAQVLGAVKKAALDYESMLRKLDSEIAAQCGPRRMGGSQVVDAEMTHLTTAKDSSHRSDAASEMRCDPAVAYESEVYESEDSGKPPWQRVRSGMSTKSCDSLEKMVHSLDLEVKQWVNARNEKVVNQELDKNTRQPSSPERLDHSMEATRHRDPDSSFESKQPNPANDDLSVATEEHGAHHGCLVQGVTLTLED
eukprot:SM000253S09036  [mRNA]  locus=s253:47097:50678:+ [translate_table: standard]